MPSFGWFDFVVLAVLVVGFFYGRKRGMSLELLPLFEVLVIIVAGAEVYRFLGQKMAYYTNGSLNMVWCYLLVYILFGIAVHMVFSRMKRMVGEKLVGSDIFGSMEYYFGMCAGIIRFACFVMIGLALLNAKAVDAKKVAANKKMQKDNFGSISFPTYESIQIDVFTGSTVGRFAKDHLKHLLIEETPADMRAQARPPAERIAKKRESAVDEVIAGGKQKK